MTNRMVEKVHSCLKGEVTNNVVSTNHGHARSVQAHANKGVQRHHTRSHACSTVTSAATNVCVFHLAHMVIKKNALATTTGKHRKANPSVLDYIIIPDSKSQATSFLSNLYLHHKNLSAP
ncbi:hypothetical protein C5167_024027 [Papaver somniferum]|uniref:Uncharacterized protein n=1 Tax=Papaver somniferum TaxID=3469 RepID=A0A4Y7JNY6_PAPSO|nr:hypothetical protein C5167_024027 [Papaver somniferum]